MQIDTRESALPQVSSPRYHRLYELSNPLNSLYMKWARARVDRVLEGKGTHPLSCENPRILLCGVACSSTASTFFDQISRRNDKAELWVLDRCAAPLESSMQALSERADSISGLHFVQADACETGFEPDFFDWIDTDFFLMFFSPEQREKLLAEMRRILKRDAVFTTREFLPSAENVPSDWIRRMIFNFVMGTQVQGMTRLELEQQLVEAGFEVQMSRVRPLSPAYDVVARPLQQV